MKKSPKSIIITAVLSVLFLIIVIGFAYIIAMITAPVNVTVAEDNVKVHCLYYDETFDYDDIATIDFREDYDSKRIKAFGGSAKQFGYYRNEEFGRHYRLTCSENKTNCIVIQKTDGSIFVFNQKKKSDTEKTYNQIAMKMSQK